MKALGHEWLALLLLVGTIVGAGMFGIPFVFQSSGFAVGVIELVFLTAAVILVHLAYGQVVLVTPGIHRMPGYVKIYFGALPARLVGLSYLLGLSGILLAYVVLGGIFLDGIIRLFFNSAPATIGTAAFYIFGASVIMRGIRFEGMVNAILALGLMMAVFILSFALLPELSLANLNFFRFGHPIVPYGVLLFSLAGFAIIPDMRRLVAGDSPVRFGRLIVIGTIIPAALYFLFASAVIGASGAATTPDAISGLALLFGPEYLLFGSVIGFLATITSFITVGLVLKGMFISDFGLNPGSAWLITSAIPAALFMLGFKDFIAIMSLVGAAAIGLDAIFILLLHRKAFGGSRPGQAFGTRLIAAARVPLIAVFAAGLALVLADFFV